MRGAAAPAVLAVDRGDAALCAAGGRRKIGRPRAPVGLNALALLALEPEPIVEVPESQVPLTPEPGVPEARRRRKPRRPRDRNHHFLPLPHVSERPAVGLMLGGSLNYSYRRPGEEFNQAYLTAWSRVSTRGVQDHILMGRVRDISRPASAARAGRCICRVSTRSEPAFGVDPRAFTGARASCNIGPCSG